MLKSKPMYSIVSRIENIHLCIEMVAKNPQYGIGLYAGFLDRNFKSNNLIQRMKLFEEGLLF